VSGLFVYELPSTLKQGDLTGNWTKHTLATGFQTVQFGPGAASPGFPYAFYPQVGEIGRSKYVHVFVCVV
jgi:hypothetical protein